MPNITFILQSEPQYERKLPDFAGENCCERNGVPEKCIWICMGGCKETSGGLFPNSVCHKYEKIAGGCCEDPRNVDQSGIIKIKILLFLMILL